MLKQKIHPPPDRILFWCFSFIEPIRKTSPNEKMKLQENELERDYLCKNVWITEGKLHLLTFTFQYK